MRDVPPHRAGIRFTRQGAQPASREDPLIRFIHALIGAGQPFLVHVEAVGIFHDELFGADDAKPRARLIAEFGLDLVEDERELPMGFDLSDEVGDDLFMRGPQGHLFAGAILEPDQHLPQHGIPSGLLPQLQGLQAGEQTLLRACAVHLITDDRGHSMEDADAERQVGVGA